MSGLSGSTGTLWANTPQISTEISNQVHAGIDSLRGQDYSPTQKVKAVDADQDVSVGIHLQKVAIHGVKHQTSVRQDKRLNDFNYTIHMTGNNIFLVSVLIAALREWSTKVSVSPSRESGVIYKSKQLLWVANRDQSLHSQIKAQWFVFRWFVYYRKRYLQWGKVKITNEINKLYSPCLISCIVQYNLCILCSFEHIASKEYRILRGETQ